MKNSPLRAKSIKLWRRSYDESLLMTHIQDKYRNLEYISEGLHNKVYKWTNEGYSFAVYEAKDSFYEEASLKEWRACLCRLERIDHPWIPKMERFSIRNKSYLVLPFMEKDVSSIERYELKSEQKIFSKLLADHNLKLDDVFQFRNSENWGIQIHDWSDLKELRG